MFGLISKINAVDGDRDKLIEVLLNGTKEMPGCKLYAVAADASDENGVWISEIWEAEEFHQASLKLPSVQQAMLSGKPLISGFEARHVVSPIGGLGVS